MDIRQDFWGIFSIILVLSLYTLPFIITYIKKKRQVGKLWSGPVHAKLNITGRPLLCAHCENDQFTKREGILVTSWVALFQLPFWNQSAACYCCTRCRHVHWFVKPQEGQIEFTREPE